MAARTNLLSAFLHGRSVHLHGYTTSKVSMLETQRQQQRIARHNLTFMQQHFLFTFWQSIGFWVVVFPATIKFAERIVDFPVETKVVGYIKGYVRRFYQASPEHRGVPTKPGRVVTLLPSTNPEDFVWGVAYKIREDEVAKVLDHLDYREKSGYEKRNVLFYPQGSNSTGHSSFELTVYIAEQQNEWFVEEPNLSVIARQIAECEGKSGTNTEYLFRLADAVKAIAPEADDTHLFELELEVKKILQNKSRPS